MGMNCMCRKERSVSLLLLCLFSLELECGRGLPQTADAEVRFARAPERRVRVLRVWPRVPAQHGALPRAGG